MCNLSNIFEQTRIMMIEWKKKELSQNNTWWGQAKEFIFLLVVVFIIRTFIFGLYQVPTGSMEVTMLVGDRFFADKLTPYFRPLQRGDIIAFNDPTFTYAKNPIMYYFQMYVWGPSNWTKRVIGIPGDKLRGVVEDGKPVIYLNDKKLEEPYLNKWPIVAYWKIPPYEIRSQRQAQEEMVFKSFDPALPFTSPQQPFYKMYADQIFRDAQGSPIIEWPTNASKNERLEAQRLDGVAAAPNQGNFWNCSDEFYVELGKDEYWCMGDNRRGSKDCRFLGPIKRELIHGRIIWRLWSIDSDESFWVFDLVKNPIEFWSRVRWNRFFQSVK